MTISDPSLNKKNETFEDKIRRERIEDAKPVINALENLIELLEDLEYTQRSYSLTQCVFKAKKVLENFTS